MYFTIFVLHYLGYQLEPEKIIGSKKKIKLKKIEHHRVDRTLTYELDVDEVLEEFESINAFWNAMTSEDEQNDKFIDFMNEVMDGPKDITEDWWTMEHGPIDPDEWSKN